MLIRLVSLSIAVALAGCGTSNLSGTYVGGDDTGAIVLDLVESKAGQINGSIAVAEANYEKGRVEINSNVVSGVSDGNRLSMIGHAKGWGASDSPFNLEVQGSSLVFQASGVVQTVTLKRSNRQDYANRLAKLERGLTEMDF